MMPLAKLPPFKKRLLGWYAKNKRSLPFRGVKDPYRIWVSEVLLQQTQMSRGVEYYKRFIRRFPTVHSLSRASWEEFLPYFRGLGFYNRGRNMLKAAWFVAEEYGGVFPNNFKRLIRIPGVGPYTANAILSFAYGRRVLTLDTNVMRILDRVFLGSERKELRIKNSKLKILVQKRGIRSTGLHDRWLTELTKKIERSFHPGESADLNQAMMDLGSSVCLAKRPKCVECPLRDICSYGRKVASRHEKVEVRSISSRTGSPHCPLPGPGHQSPVVGRGLTKHPIALIHWEERVLLQDFKLPAGDSPVSDERAFLKGLAIERLGLEISVRPPFLRWMSGGKRCSAHRCYVLSGLPPDRSRFILPGDLASVEAIESYL